LTGEGYEMTDEF